MLSLKNKTRVQAWGLAHLIWPYLFHLSVFGFPHCANNEWRRYARRAVAMFKAHSKMTTIDDNYI